MEYGGDNPIHQGLLTKALLHDMFLTTYYLCLVAGQLQCGDPPDLAGLAETVDQASLLEFDQLTVVYK